MATKAEKRHMARVAALPCAACGAYGVQVHHIRDGQGIGQRASNYLIIPLCDDCHLGPLSIHKTKRQFERIYGSELDLLADTIKKLMETKS